MKTMYEQLQSEHQRLLGDLDARSESDAFLVEVKNYIEHVQAAAQQVAASRDRGQLRANLRYWASFVYDRTGTYPDTTMRPSDVAAADQAELRPSGPLASAIAFVLRSKSYILLVFLLLIATAVVLSMLGPVIGNVFTDISEALPEGTLSKESGSSRVTAATKELAEGQTKTPVPPTVTILPSATQTPTLIPTLELTPTATDDGFLIPVTGGGCGELQPYYRMRLWADYAAATKPLGCTSRYLDIHFVAPLSAKEYAQTSIQVSQTGGGVILSETGFLPERELIRYDLLRFQATSDAYYLLRLDHPLYSAVDLIFKYSPSCDSESLSIAYELLVACSTLEEEPRRNPNLALDWRLVTWGPEPPGSEIYGAWIAQLELIATGGDGSYIFWQSDPKGELHPLDGNQLTLRGADCWPANVVVGVTSGGEAVTRELSLQVPYCP